MRQRAAGGLAGHRPLVDREHAVDQHGPHPRRQQRRLLIGGARGIGARIEHHDIGEGAGTQMAAALQPERIGGQRRTSLDELAQGDHMIGLDVFVVLAGEGAIDARMAARGIGPGHHPGLLHEGGDIGLALVERDGAGIADADHGDRGVDRRQVHLLRDRIEIAVPVFALDDQQLARPAALAEILDHAGVHLLGQRGIVEALEQRRAAPVLRPKRDERGDQARARGGPGILVGGDLLAASAGGVDLGDDRRRLPLHVDAQCLDVADMRGQPALATDADRLVDRGGQAHGIAALVADMAVIAAAALARFLGELDHFLGLGEALGA